MNSNDLIVSVKRRASIPEAQETFEDTDFLDFANEEQAIGLVPSILQYHEEYFVRNDDIPLVTGTVIYKIPYRAIGNKLRDLTFVDASGNESPMIKISKEDQFDFTLFDFNPKRYRIEAGNIILLTSITSPLTGSLRASYYLRPNNLVLLERAARVASIDTVTGVVTFDDNLPDHFDDNILYDMNRTKSDHKIISFDVEPVVVGANSITFDADDIPSDLEVGDYICQSGETVIPNILTDLHVILAHRVATRCLESLGDSQGLSNANTKLQEMEMKTGNLIDNRVESQPVKVINRNSFLRSSRWRNRWRP